MYPYSVGVLNFILHVLSIHVKWNYMYSLLVLSQDWIVDYIYFYLFYKIWSLCSGFWLFNICIPLLVCFDLVKVSLEWYFFISLKKFDMTQHLSVEMNIFFMNRICNFQVILAWERPVFCTNIQTDNFTPSLSQL